MKVLTYILIGGICLLFLLSIIYFFFLLKLKNINNKIYKYKEINNLKENNVLIIYQPSRHKTTFKISQIVKEEVEKKGYGTKVHTLTKEDEDYSKYKNVIFVLPVYFGEVNSVAIEKLTRKISNNILIIYNGLNSESNNEDNLVKQKSKNKYSKIKVHTTDLENVVEFINKGVL